MALHKKLAEERRKRKEQKMYLQAQIVYLKHHLAAKEMQLNQMKNMYITERRQRKRSPHLNDTDFLQESGFGPMMESIHNSSLNQYSTPL